MARSQGCARATCRHRTAPDAGGAVPCPPHVQTGISGEGVPAPLSCPRSLSLACDPCPGWPPGGRSERVTTAVVAPVQRGLHVGGERAAHCGVQPVELNVQPGCANFVRSWPLPGPQRSCATDHGGRVDGAPVPTVKRRWVTVAEQEHLTCYQRSAPGPGRQRAVL